MLAPVTWVGSSFVALYLTFTLPYGSDEKLPSTERCR